MGLSSKEIKIVLRYFTSVDYAFVNLVYSSNLSSLASEPAGIISVDEGTKRGERYSPRNESHADEYSVHFLNSLIEALFSILTLTESSKLVKGRQNRVFMRRYFIILRSRP